MSKQSNFRTPNGKVHRTLEEAPYVYLCGIGRWATDRETTHEVTCKHCLRWLAKAKEEK